MDDENLAGGLSKNNYFKNTFQKIRIPGLTCCKRLSKNNSSVLVVNGPSSYSNICKPF